MELYIDIFVIILGILLFQNFSSVSIVVIRALFNKDLRQIYYGSGKVHVGYILYPLATLGFLIMSTPAIFTKPLSSNEFKLGIHALSLFLIHLIALSVIHPEEFNGIGDVRLIWIRFHKKWLQYIFCPLSNPYILSGFGVAFIIFIIVSR